MLPSAVFFLFVIIGYQKTNAGVITNEDIRDAILQIVNVVRSVDDKLERHEYRDRALGEQLKKGMINIDKRIKMLDPLKGTVSRLDERLAAVETILMQKNEREKMQLQRTYEAVLDIQRNLPIIMEQLKNDIISKISISEPPAQMMEPVISKKDFEKVEKGVLNKMDNVISTISKMESELIKIKENNKNLNDINDKSSENYDKVKRHLDTSEQLLAKYDNKLAEYNNKIPSVPLPNYKEQDEWRGNLMKALDAQKSHVVEVISDVKNIKNIINDLPKKNDLNILQKATLNTLEKIKHDTKQQINSTDKKLIEIRKDINSTLNNNHKDTVNNINDLSDIVLNMTRNSATHGGIRVALQPLNKVMVQISDNILDTRRRVENALDAQKSHVADVKNIKDLMNDLPRKYDLSILQNATLNTLEKIKHDSKQQMNSTAKVLINIRNDINSALNKNPNDTGDNIDGLSDIVVNLTRSCATNYGGIRDELQQAMVQISDNILDTKRRVEYALDSQKTHMKDILLDVKTLREELNDLPRKHDLSVLQNATLNKLEDIKHDTKVQPNFTDKMLIKIRDDINSNLNGSHEETIRNINVLSDIAANLAESFAENYGKLKDQMQALGKVDQVMIQTADNVLDTKRRVEYGVHQIISEVSKHMKENTNEIMRGVNERLDNFEISMLDEETGALANATSKIEEDIEQVWRQIGIMYQQMTASTDTLNKLQNQTDSYVNGSLNVMDTMQGKVGLITGKMGEVDENLNYLLGRLSLVTKEFNQIKTGLGKALEEIRGSFHTVQDKMAVNNSPGPHKISSIEVDSV